jgi:hypothetical protein
VTLTVEQATGDRTRMTRGSGGGAASYRFSTVRGGLHAVGSCSPSPTSSSCTACLAGPCCPAQV